MRASKFPQSSVLTTSRKLSNLGFLPASHHAFATVSFVLILTALCLPILLAFVATERVLRGGLDLNDWRSVDPVADAASLPHLDVRQAWIYAEHGNALERTALVHAGGLQDGLLNDAHVDDAKSTKAFVQSLLNGVDVASLGLDSNDSVLATVNGAMTRQAPDGLTPWPASTLAAPLVGGHKVIRAAGIVASLFSTPGSAVGDVWHRNSVGMALHLPEWHMLRSSNWEEATGSVLVSARRTSLWDDMVFYTLYAAAAAYLLHALHGVTRVANKTLQSAAMVIQVFTSTTVALTLTHVLGIDLLTVPWKAYPLVPVAQCLGNSLQLIDEIEKSPSNSKAMSVSGALERLGTTPISRTARNAILLLVLSSVAPRGLASFAYFGAISIVIDLFVFFALSVTVLSVNIRGISLEETFSDTDKHAAQRSHHGYADLGRSSHTSLAFPGSRYTASLIGTGLLFAFLSTHFLDSARAAAFRRVPLLDLRPYTSRAVGHAVTLQHVADTHRWLRTQDSKALHEIMGLAGIGASSFVAEIYEPLTIVSKAAGTLKAAAGDIWLHQLRAALADKWVWIPTAVFSAISLVGLSLWEAFCLPHGADEPSQSGAASDISSVKCLAQAHTLDVFLLAAESRRFLVSVGFDREVRLWDLESSTPSSQTIPYSPTLGVRWPITSVSIDSRAEWIAICSQDHHVALWNRQNQCFGLATTTDSRIVSCVFARLPTVGKFPMVMSRLLLILETGALVDIDIDSGRVIQAKLCNSQVRSAHISSNPRMPARLVVLTENDGVFISVNRDGWWSTRPLHLASLDFSSSSTGRQAFRFSVIPSLKGVGIAYNEEKSELHLLDLFTGAQIYTFHPRSLRFSTLRALHSPPQSCVYCGSTAVASFSIAYTEKGDGPGASGGNFIMTTISAEHSPEPYRTGLICLRADRDARERRCVGFVRGAEVVHIMSDPGVWEATGANGVAGVRRREVALAGGSPNGTTAFKLLAGDGGRLANRKAARARAVDERWEAWTMTAKGIISSHLLTTSLLTNKSGPVCRLARNAVAVGLADIIVLVQFGSHLHDNDDQEGGMAKPTYGKLSRQGSRQAMRLGRYGS